MESENQENLVTVESGLDQKAFLRGVANERHVVLTVVTGALQQRARAPFSLCVVLDASGSMSGDKMSASKDAIKRIIDTLQPDDDLSFIVFDNVVQVIFVHGDLKDRESLKARVEAVEARGSTNLSGGIIAGALSQGAEPNDGGFFTREAAGDMAFLADASKVAATAANYSSRRLFVFSDGAANKGLTKQKDLELLASDVNEAGVAVSTFGLGEDFNELVMTGIAKKGNGQFTYVKNANLIDQYVSDAFGNLTRLIGTNATLHVRGRGVCTVTKIYDQETTSLASLKDLRDSNRTQVVVRLQAMPSDAVPETDVAPVLEWELSYKSVQTGEVATKKGIVEGHFTTKAEVANEINATELSAVLQLQSGELDLEVTRLLDANDRAKAIEKKKEGIALLERAVKIDPTNAFAPIMLLGAHKTLKKLESKRSVNKVKKAVQWGGYLQRRASISAMSQMDGYIVEESSSDEEDASPSYSTVTPPVQSSNGPVNRRRLS